jgi:hypothetical protein
MAALGRFIALNPAVIGGVERRGNAVAVLFSEQACYSDATGSAPRRVPLYACELVIDSAEVKLQPKDLPVTCLQWELISNGGTHSIALPVELSVDGPVKFWFGDRPANRLVVVGTHARFHVGQIVRELEQWPAT